MGYEGPIYVTSVTELIGVDEQVSATKYSASAGLTLRNNTGAATSNASGEILQVALYSYQTSTGDVLTNAGDLYLFDTDPAVAADAPALAGAGGEHKTLIGIVPVGVGDWVSDSDGAATLQTVSIPFQSLTTIYASYRLATGSTQFNSSSGDDEKLDMRLWYRRDG